MGRGTNTNNLFSGRFGSSQGVRDLDWGDVERILIRQHGKLNLNQIRSELKPLLELKGEAEALSKLDQKLEIVERRLRAKP